MKELMFSLMTWLSPVLGEPVPPTVPNVIFAAHCDIQALFHDNGAHECTDDGVQAVYLKERDTIYLDAEWKPTSLYHVAVLLHELVHYMQDIGGHWEKAACIGELEARAYDAQYRWLDAAGVDGHAVMETNPLYIRLVTQCRDNSAYE